MASGSKKSNLPLTKEEQEEEELRNELINSNCEFFYEGISVDEMKMIMNELKKSKEINSQNTEIVPPSPPPSESKSSQNSLQTSESNINRPLPSFSYKQAVISSNLPTASTSNEDFNSREKSPDPTSNKTYGKNLINENDSHDSESIFENNSNINNDDYPQLGSKSNLKSNPYEQTSTTRVLRPREAKKPTPAMIRKLNLERWRLDPLQFLEDDDVPLKRPEHVHNHQEEFLPYSNEKLDDETFEALCQQMSEKLDSLHEQMIATDSQTIWGSPIKVSGKRNSPADKNSFVEKTPTFSSHVSDVSIRDSMERSSKRKALNFIAAATENNSNDESSGEEFAKTNTKKRKCHQQEKKAEEVPKKVREDQENKNNNPVEMIDVNQTDDFSDSLFDNSDLQRLQRVTKRTRISNNPDPVENESAYPRRITPPNPVKKSCKGPRYRKKNSTQSQSTSKKNSEALDDNEISNLLNNEPDEMTDSDCIEITDEIKPSSNAKGMQRKLSNAQSHLENKKIAMEEKVKAEEEARKRKEIDERLKKDELISKRIQEEEDEKSRQLEKERKRKEQELFYNNILQGPQKRVTRSNVSASIPRNYEEMDEDQLLADDDDDITLTHSNIVTKNCPICQKPFPAEQIMNHASECNLFPEESNGIHSFQPSTSYSRRDNSYECTICNDYTTYDGKRYEEHVTKCREKAEDQRVNGIYHLIT